MAHTANSGRRLAATGLVLNVLFLMSYQNGMKFHSKLGITVRYRCSWPRRREGTYKETDTRQNDSSRPGES